MAWIKKTKVEKHLSLSLRDYNILYINGMHYFDGDRCSENRAKTTQLQPLKIWNKWIFFWRNVFFIVYLHPK